MERIQVRSAGGGYTVHVGRGVLEDVLPSLLTNLSPRRVAVVTHPSIKDLHGGRLENSLRKASVSEGNVVLFAFPEGEDHKTLRTLEEGYRALLRAGVNREDLILAFGGGVVGDLAGFLAATYMRGIRYLQVPTTLMAMVDSSIGGKVGVDLPEGKNLVGAFYRPEAVLADISLLETLPRREMLSGLAEVAKYGFLYDGGILAEMEGWVEGIPGAGYDFSRLVAACSARKAGVVSVDERDLSGERALLNYGHTFGHALEAATAYHALRHGEAVALGMIMAARLAESVGMARVNLLKRHLQVLSPLLREARLPRDLSADLILAHMETDKKKAEALRFVLLEGWQEPRLAESPTANLVRQAVEETLREAVFLWGN